jgi:RHS repeat-associated protein
LSQTASKGTGPPDHNPTVSASTNRVLNVGAQTWSYDAAGNTTNDGSRTYAYDANNRITQVGGGSPAEYRYDGEGNRVMKVVGSDTIRYVMGLAEHSTATGWRALYVYLGSEKLVEYRYANSTRFFHNDHLGTTKAVTDHTGLVLERWDHYPFGEEWVSGLTGDRYRYTGHLRDQETGNDYAGARYYTNARGRWLSVDPVLHNLDDPQSLNRYAYVFNDPVNHSDPDGAVPSALNCSEEVEVKFYPGEASWKVYTVCTRSPLETARQDPNSRGGGSAARPDTLGMRFELCSWMAFGKGATTLGNRALPTFAATGLILQVSAATGVDPVLLAATWAIESNFNLHHIKNNRNRSDGTVDIGPMQLNYQYWTANNRRLDILTGTGYSLTSFSGRIVREAKSLTGTSWRTSRRPRIFTWITATR